MRAKVTAVVVARRGGEYLERTLAALREQVRPADHVTLVELGSEQAAATTAAAGMQRMSAADSLSFGQAVHAATRILPPAQDDDEWLWLLGADNAPEPGALAALLAEVERSPSVAIAGPKQMQWADPGYIYSFGETLTPAGSAVEIAEPELDQAQYDRESDVLAVAAGGMLVRQRLWERLEGFDPGLPAVDDALDFCVRARLAGSRVVVVPAARVLSAGRHAPGTAQLGARTSRNARARLARTAQLHRRLAYAPAPAVPLHWLTLLPLAVLRALGQLLRKRPGRVIGEFWAAFAVAFGHGGSVAAARRRIARNRAAGWASVAPLRLPWQEVRRRRALARDEALTATRAGRHEHEFFTGGGVWTVGATAVVGLLAFFPLIGAVAVRAPGLLPLGGVSDLWNAIGWGWREAGAGFLGSADPFAWVLAILGTLTAWAPSFSIVLLYLTALPLAALGAWFAASRLTARPVLRVLGSLVWAFAPPLLVALGDGRLGAVLAHLLLPWLGLALWSARRSWTASATAALLAAALLASAPSLVPALLVIWAVAVIGFALVGRRGRGWHRLLPLPLPAAALFAPLVVEQLLRGAPLAILADPGLVVATGPTGSSGAPLERILTLLAGQPLVEQPWSAIGAGLGLDIDGWLVSALLLAPLVAAAITAPFLPRAARAVPALVVAALGLATALAAGHVIVATITGVPVSVWPGSGLSLYLFGLSAAAITALEAGAGRVTLAVRRSVAGLVIAGVAVSAVPLLLTTLTGSGAQPGSVSTVPALVTAESATDRTVGTLVVGPAQDGVAARLERGSGSTLEEQSTLYSTSRVGDLSDDDRSVAVLVGNLASRSGYDAAADLDALRIGFVLLAPGGSEDIRARVAAALDANSLFTPVTSTEIGTLWRYVGIDDRLAPAPTGPGPWGSPLGVLVLASQLLVLGLTFLLALPTGALAERVRPEREVRRGRGTAGRRAAGQPVTAVPTETPAREERPEPAATQTDSATSDTSTDERELLPAQGGGRHAR